MLQYDWTLVMCIDAVAQPCVAAHLMGEDTGRERLVALIRAPYERMPFVCSWEHALTSRQSIRLPCDQAASLTDPRAQAQATEMFHVNVQHPPVHGTLPREEDAVQHRAT